MAGSTGSGGDIEAGRQNCAESTTELLGGRPSELDKQFSGRAVLEVRSRRDGQRADSTLNGVLGLGWNGPIEREPGAGVIGVGAPNHGPGMVGLGGGRFFSDPFLGFTVLGGEGLGGTGVIGIGGVGNTVVEDLGNDDVAADAPFLPGAGMVGQGGTSFFSDPSTGHGPGIVGIAGPRLDGEFGRPGADLSKDALRDTANVGVFGFGGDGWRHPGDVGPARPGAGVRGVGGVAGFPGEAVNGGPGIVGVAGDVPKVKVPLDSTLINVGVAGFAEQGNGVRGVSMGTTGVAGVRGFAEHGNGVEGSSIDGQGVLATSEKQIGVSASSVQAVGGSFASDKVAQVHLEPHPKPMADPNGQIPGQAGDLLVLKLPQEAQFATLWFCRRTGNAATAMWINLT